MKKVFKFSVPLIEASTIQMHVGAVIRRFDSQRDGLYIWAEVDPERPIETRAFKIFGTGHEIHQPDGLQYIGTTFLGPHVWHLYEDRVP